MGTSRVPRVFLDTNVVFSGFRSTHAPPGQILRLHLDGRLRAIVSRQVVTELIRNLLVKSAASIPALQAFVAHGPPEVIETPSREQVLAAIRLGVNPDDAPILAAALAADADYLVSGDQAFVEECRSATSALKVLSPREFLLEIAQ